MYYIHKSINKTFYAYQLCFSSPLNHNFFILFFFGGGGRCGGRGAVGGERVGPHLWVECKYTDG